MKVPPPRSEPVIPHQWISPHLNKQQRDLQGLIKDIANEACAACIFTPFWLQPRGLQHTIISARNWGTRRSHAFLKVTQSSGRGGEKTRSVRYLSIPGWISETGASQKSPTGCKNLGCFSVKWGMGMKIPKDLY